MFRLLIVDDEYYVRVGIKSAIDWSEIGVEVVGEAADGEEALEILKNAGVPAVRIGFVKEQNARTLVNGEETRYLDRPAPDELSRWWKERKESELCIKTEE